MVLAHAATRLDKNRVALGISALRKTHELASAAGGTAPLPRLKSQTFQRGFPEAMLHDHRPLDT
jgi:hypothetical protein